jgi:hypothetical protein
VIAIFGQTVPGSRQEKWKNTIRRDAVGSRKQPRLPLRLTMHHHDLATGNGDMGAGQQRELAVALRKLFSSHPFRYTIENWKLLSNLAIHCDARLEKFVLRPTIEAVFQFFSNWWFKSVLSSYRLPLFQNPSTISINIHGIFRTIVRSFRYLITICSNHQ